MATKVANHQTTRPLDDPLHLDYRHRLHHPLGAVFRPGRGVRGRTRYQNLRGSVAAGHERNTLFYSRQFSRLLYPADAFNIPLLYPDLDKGVAPVHTGRHARRPNGPHATEVEGEGGKDASRCSHPFRTLVAAPLRHLCAYQVRRSHEQRGGGNLPDSHADRAVARQLQLMH